MNDTDASRIKILQLPLGPLQTNCYVLACTNTGKAAIIDPAWDGDAIARTIAENGWELAAVWLTHSHFDHVGGLADLQRRFPAVPVAIHPEAMEMLMMAERSAQVWGITVESPSEPTVLLADGQLLELGDLRLTVLYTPGHAPGHVCLYLQEFDVVFDGDVLFEQSIGRTDLPGGDFDVLMASIQDKLLTLPDETVVLSGHGGATTIGAERRSNPFLTELTG